MIQAAEAVIDANGRVRLLGKVRVDGPRRALVTVLEEPAAVPDEAALLAVPALAEDWSRPGEDAVWSRPSRVVAPRLADPERAADFAMEVAEDPEMMEHDQHRVRIH